ncbi:glycoside hydrolase family 13 protein [Alkalicoccobacillus porphyridii]|uniref:Alpha-glycosidase n=1 Tax=Alkalicoccobacillus porphyridii TaxID=2597270 RepID=A0A553ZWT0_9BACI|nr:glycoside hydrolase family 13 protein [Alkalicoccobacillus porphyridii]TSB45919.1 alpha-glycosidase [Alkalicoccobacillus porphyridii]
MIKEAIYHRPKDNFAYAYDKETLHIRLRSKKGDLTKVSLIYGDPYEWNDEGWKNSKKTMTLEGTDELFDIWFVEVKPKYKRMRYGFEIKSNENFLIYGEDGFIEKDPKNAHFYFCFPFLNENDVFNAPAWVKDTIWYQIFPERFANGNPLLNPKNTIPWGSTEPQFDTFFGGDLEGIINNIGHLTELGVNGIYLTPIFKAKSNHKYDTIDYMEIDPQFGDKKTFKKLIEVCHENNIRVMLDAVFNHSGFYFEPFQHVLEYQEKSKYRDWFHLRDIKVKALPEANYDTFAFTHLMPKLNTENEELKKYLLEVGKYWVEEFDIDGWRLDVANEVDHQFWRDFRKTVKSVKPDAYILGEVWHDSMPWLQGDQFDAVMNYPFTQAVVEYIAKDEINSEVFKHKLIKLLSNYPKNVNEYNFNLLGSHDTPRILTLCQDNKDKLKLLFLLQFSFIGSPCIYYGDEIGLTGEGDPSCRKCMVWDKDAQDTDLFTFLKKLIDLRKRYSAFGANGQFEVIESAKETNHIMYSKKTVEEQIIITINNSNSALKVHLPFDISKNESMNLWDNKPQKISEIEIEPLSFSIIKL